MSSYHGEGISRSRTGESGGFTEFVQRSGASAQAPAEPAHIEGPWQDSPSVSHQITAFPKSWRFGGPEQYEVFQLPEQKEAINLFLQDTFPLDASKKRIMARTETPNATGMLVVLRYVKLEYMRLAPTPSLPPTT